MNFPKKPLGGKNYGSIPHLPGSRMGKGDHHCHEGQERIACAKKRDKHDRVIVQEKLDGSNVGVALLDRTIYPLVRSGYIATTSKFEQHRYFAEWVRRNTERFRAVLEEGERVCGEWLIQAHGTKYKLDHEPFVAFDIINGNKKRKRYDVFKERMLKGEFVTPHVVSDGQAISIEDVMDILGIYGFHGAIDPVEGAVWRIERKRKVAPGKTYKMQVMVDFLVKYVRPDKVDGCYLESVTGEGPIYNEYPRIF